jgi:hypothetical protein
VIFEKNHSQWQGERNLGVAKLRRKRQKTLGDAARGYLGVEKKVRLLKYGSTFNQAGT